MTPRPHEDCSLSDLVERSSPDGRFQTTGHANHDDGNSRRRLASSRDFDDDTAIIQGERVVCKRDNLSWSTARLVNATQSDNAPTPPTEWPHWPLCGVCKKAFEAATEHTRNLDNFRLRPPDQQPQANDEYFHHGSLIELEKCAAESCPLCHLFLITMEEGVYRSACAKETSFLLGFWNDHVHKDSYSKGMAITDLVFKRVGEVVGDKWYEIRACQTGNELFYSRSIRPWPSLAVGREWIMDCLLNHDCSPNDSSALPTRILDVGSSNSDPIQLISSDTISIEKSRGYVALSHCWGSQAPESRTRSSNYQDHCRCLDLESLEKTFKDAVTATRDLGFRYLWIDTFCIIQDNEGDWERECSRMDTVFSNAVVVLAAVDSRDAYSGFLTERQSPTGPICEISLRGPEVDLGKITIQATARIASRESLMLSRRAWAFQEQVLPTRLLYFSKRQLCFQCSHGIRYEVTPYPHQPSPLGFDEPTTLYPRLTTSMDGDEDELLQFYRAVRYYSERALSKETDRLPALSGIARRYHEISRDQYLAGLWRRDLIRGLTWATDTAARSKDQDSGVYIAPSWSWASLGKAAFWSNADAPLEPLAQVISAFTKCSGQNPFGEIVGGEIRLLASISRLESIGMCRVRPIVSGTDRQDPLLQARLPKDIEHHPDRGYKYASFWPDDFSCDSTGHAVEANLFCVLLARVQMGCGNEWYGLAVRPVEGEDGTYARVGLIEDDGGSVLSCMQHEEQRLLRVV